jgi:NADPH:quinone reductase-like Zn-dependent oxidoreductase
MRAAGITEIGGEVTLLNLPNSQSLGPDEARINVVNAGVGNWDEFVRTGGWDVGVQPPMALGVEAAGKIVETGGGIRDFAVGDEVLTHGVPLLQHGFWADQAIVNAAHLALKPESVSWQDAAALPVPGLVAAQVMADSLRLRAGDSILVNGAGGVTGGLIVQLAVLMRLTVVATAGVSSAERVSRFGAHAVLDYRESDWPIEARELIGGRGFTAGVNAARGGAASTLKAIADGGQLATITGDPPPAERGITIQDVYVRPDGSKLSDLAQLFSTGRLSLPIGATHRLSDAAEALALSVSGHAGGAVVLAISEGSTDTDERMAAHRDRKRTTDDYRAITRPQQSPQVQAPNPSEGDELTDVSRRPRSEWEVMQ